MPVVENAGRRLLVARSYGQRKQCEHCQSEYVVTSITGRQRYCSERCKELARYARTKTMPAVVNANRSRFSDWYAARRRSTQPWLYGAPAYGQYLPGGAFSLRITPAPQWPIELRNTRALHGLATELLGEPHSPGKPGFALIPTGHGCGWGLYVASSERALQLAGRQQRGVLFDREVIVSCGPMHRIKTPQVTARGRRRLRIDAITPVHIRRDNSSRTHLTPTGGNLCSALAFLTPRRLELDLHADAVRLELVERHTTPEWTPMLGKYGVVGGFTGHVIVECNAVAHWLLKCCETIGMGGKTAFGFGRIRVQEQE